MSPLTIGQLTAPRDSSPLVTKFDRLSKKATPRARTEPCPGPTVVAARPRLRWHGSCRWGRYFVGAIHGQSPNWRRRLTLGMVKMSTWEQELLLQTANMTRRHWLTGMALVTLAPWSQAQEPAISPPATPAADSATGSAGGTGAATQLNAIVDRGLKFLAEQGQAADGTFSSSVGPGVTALVVTAALRHDRPLDDPLVAKGLAALEKFVRPDGGIYGSGRLKNYETCVGILCFAAANKNGQYDKVLAAAKEFVSGLQVGATDGTGPDANWYGGAGYGGGGSPDLSNTAYFVEALHALEAPPTDPALQRALRFLSRSQNLQSEHNQLPWAEKHNDGGFTYFVPSEKELESADKQEEIVAGMRSNGSMTYSGLKSMIYAGLTPDDPRVKAAVEWIGKNYALDSNPGLGDAGLYYYYHTFATALAATGLDTIADSQGQTHDWRAELVAALAERQNPDGSWTNANQRWFENDANLATSFALLALSYCRKP